MSKRPTSPTEPIAVQAALADGRTCLGCDRDGEWRLTLILPSAEGARLATRLHELRDKTFFAVFQLRQES